MKYDIVCLCPFNDSLLACNQVKSKFYYLFMRTIKSSRCFPFNNTHVSSAYKIVIKIWRHYRGHSYK